MTPVHSRASSKSDKSPDPASKVECVSNSSCVTRLVYGSLFIGLVKAVMTCYDANMERSAVPLGMFWVSSKKYMYSDFTCS